MRLVSLPFIAVLYGFISLSIADPIPNSLVIPAFRPVLRSAPAEVFPRLSRRQLSNDCVNIGYSPCPDRTACCPSGYSCIGSGILTQCSLFGGVCPPGSSSCADGSTTNSGCCRSGTVCGAIAGTCVRRDSSNTVTLTPTASVVIVTAPPSSDNSSSEKSEKDDKDEKGGNSVPIGPIIGGIGGAALLIAGAVLGARYYFKRKKQRASEEPAPVIPIVGGGKPDDQNQGSYYAPPAYPQPVAEVKPAFNTNSMPVVPQPANLNMSAQMQQQQQMNQNQMYWDQSRMSNGGSAYKQSSYNNNNNPGSPIYRQELDGISTAAPGYTSTPISPVTGMHPYPQDYRELDGASSPPPGGYASPSSPIQRAVSPASTSPTQYGNQWGQGNHNLNQHPPQN